jgi:hypothetical protein
VYVYYSFEIGGPESRYRLLNFQGEGQPDFCCAEMRKQWGVSVDLALHGFPRPENIGVCLCVGHLLQGGIPLASVSRITRCPWCGVAIRLREAASIPGDDLNGLLEDF